jgi:uncharacterized protein (TIGR00369 family)
MEQPRHRPATDDDHLAASRRQNTPDMDKDAFFWKIMAGELPTPPAMKTLGGKIVRVDPVAATIEIEFQAKAEFANPAGHIQGGFLAAMLDDTMGPALAATLRKNQFAPTLNLNVSFQRTASVGTIQGSARVVRRGRDVCHLAGELSQNGEIVASATATALIRG